MMSFSQSVKTCFNKFVTFSGRASRAEYWWFQLFLLLSFIAFFLVGIMAIMLSETIGGGGNGATPQGSQWSFWIMLVLIIFFLITFLPTLSVTIRRFHDVGIASWIGIVLLLFAYFSAGFGSIIVFIISLLPSGEDNKYGVRLKEEKNGVFTPNAVSESEKIVSEDVVL